MKNQSSVKKHSFVALFTGAIIALGSATADVSHADFDSGKRAFDAKYFDKARSEWSKSATEGDPQSQFHLGQLFDNGTGVRENNTQAYFWYALASLGGLAEAKAQLNTLKSEMSSEEISRAKDLTERFERVFAPVRYITVEPESNLADSDVIESDPSSDTSVGESKARDESNAIEPAVAQETEQSDDSTVAQVAEKPDQELDDETRIAKIQEQIETPKNNDIEAVNETVKLEAAEVSVITVANDQNLDLNEEKESTPEKAPGEDLIKTAAVRKIDTADTPAASDDEATPVENRGVLTEKASQNPQAHLRERMKSLIREVQTMLNELGYTAGPADGVIGKKTRQAVVRFQKEIGLPDNGELGPQTIRALRVRS